MMRNDVFNERKKIKRRMQWCLDAKMTKRGFKIAYRSEIVEKEVEMSRVKPLPSVSCTQVKTHVCKQDPAYTGPSPHTQSLKNKPTYTRTELRMQAQAHARKSTDKKSPSTFSSIYHPKSFLNMFRPLLMCQVFI